jgi:antitoxin (DNA-binding transcriptional repressor) of toxin-antitoxin stability system
MKLEIEETELRMDEIINAFEAGTLNKVMVCRNGKPSAWLLPLPKPGAADQANSEVR